MIPNEELLELLEIGQIAEYRRHLLLKSAAQVVYYSFWLHFIAAERFSDVLVTRAFLHNKLAYEAHFA